MLSDGVFENCNYGFNRNIMGCKFNNVEVVEMNDDDLIGT